MGLGLGLGFRVMIGIRVLKAKVRFKFWSTSQEWVLRRLQFSSFGASSLKDCVMCLVLSRALLLHIYIFKNVIIGENMPSIECHTWLPTQLFATDVECLRT